jgi:hypothetical protein
MIAAEPLIFAPTRAAEGGEIRSSYFQNTPPIRNLQIRDVRLAPLGGQSVLFFGRKRKGFINKGKRNFFQKLNL